LASGSRAHLIEGTTVPDEMRHDGTDPPGQAWAAAPELDPATYRSLLKALPDMALLLFDRDLRLRLAISDALSTPAWRPKELVGRMVAEVLATGRGPQALDHCRAALAGNGGPVELAVDGLLLRGEVVPVLDAAGTVTGGLVLAVDASVQPREQEALRESEQQLRASMEAMPDPVAVYQAVRDDQDVIVNFQAVYANDPACQLSGLTREAFLGTALAELDQARSGLVEGCRRVVETGEPFWVEALDYNDPTAVETPTGAHDVRAAKLGDGVLVVWRDITARKRAEEALSRANAEMQQRTADLERVNADLDQFAYAAAHDLKEPLRAISATASLLARQYSGRLDTNADDFLTDLVQGVGRMQTLIEELLAFAQVDGGQQRFEPVETAKAAEEATANLRVLLREADATVTQAALPVVTGDRVQLTQLFQNLVANAVKFHSHRPPVVHLSAERREGAWCFAVADNGIGVDPAYAERIFEMFQRLHGRGEYSGTGIGLATCKRVVERHGGRIWVDPTKGGGSTFRFTIADQVKAAQR